MKYTTECNERSQLHIEDYLCDDRVEPERSMGVQSSSFTSSKGQNDGSEYAGSLLDKILDRDNMNGAYKRVKSNKGSHGIDGMTVDELLQFLKENGDQIRQSIREGTYKPKPVRRVEIPKPGGGKRLLGIPTVLDRVVQQAAAQVLSPIFEKQFSEWSYGFRPGRDAKQAVLKCKEYRIFKLNQSITGWVNYFGMADMKGIAAKLDGWIRRRIRMCYWKQWKKISTKHKNLV